ncbi:hypothetical protein SAY87_001265 [Trapa incisa]|uniref:Uncharacterized protein n=1 Tax=Trapa incisa TaxID=236973 RepID=A0AAN7GSU4_9MYRT|nr:hypothetical protein SAY87_001265 [Trapa incisa]
MSGEGTELGNPLLGFLIFTSEDTNQITTRFPLLRLINVQVLLKILGLTLVAGSPSSSSSGSGSGGLHNRAHHILHFSQGEGLEDATVKNEWSL